MLIELFAAAATMAAPQDYQARAAPRGDYRQSCGGEYVNRGRLYADCRDDRGRVRATSIELNRCSDYEIRAREGLLVCGPVRGQYEDRGGWPGSGGGGVGGRGEISVYRDAGYRGASTTFEGVVPNLRNSGFNDNISSLRFRGSWEVCTDANFQGRCEVLNGDVANLEQYRLNDRISSLRPARGDGQWGRSADFPFNQDRDRTRDRQSY